MACAWMASALVTASPRSLLSYIHTTHKSDGSEHKEAAVAEPGMQRQKDKIGNCSCKNETNELSASGGGLGIHIAGGMQQHLVAISAGLLES